MRWHRSLAFGLCFCTVSAVVAQLTPADIAALRDQGQREGWTFTVSENPATQYPLDELCGVRVPKDWRARGRFDDLAVQRDLPAAFDWRNFEGHNGCTPIRNQGGCGSCWAFSTIAPLECNILIRDGVSTDLSEQWLVSCTNIGGCSGAWPGDAVQFLLRNGPTDPCGGRGAVLEADFPYVGYDAPCRCPYPHPYFVDDWAFIGPQWGIPTDAQIKQAILDYGPVSVCVYANSAFQGYSGGVFNACVQHEINHAVALVGWNDNQGTRGVWILRNSWGPNWGESGYMRIAYGCSLVGYHALYERYVGVGQPEIVQPPVSQNVCWRGPVAFTVSASGTPPLHYQWRKDGADLVDDGRIAGARTSALAIQPVVAADAGAYDVVVSNQGHSVASPAATLTVRPCDDLNCDGVANFDDINPFVLALSDPVGYARQYPGCDIMNGDVNGDGHVDFGDVEPFVAVLSGGS